MLVVNDKKQKTMPAESKTQTNGIYQKKQTLTSHRVPFDLVRSLINHSQPAIYTETSPEATSFIPKSSEDKLDYYYLFDLPSGSSHEALDLR